MAPSTTKKPDLLDTATVLRAIHNDPVENRDDRNSQMDLLRGLVKEKQPHLQGDELEEATDRLRKRLMTNYKGNAKCTVPPARWGKPRYWTPPPFSQLFCGGFNVFPETYLARLGIDWKPADDEVKSDEEHKEDNGEEIGTAMAEDQSQPNASSSKHVDEPSSTQGSTIHVGSSQKRKVDEVQSDAVAQLSDAPRTKRLQLQVTPTSGDTAVLRTQSDPPLLRNSNSTQNRRQPVKSQEPAAIRPDTQAAGCNATSRTVKITIGQRHGPAGRSEKESRSIEQDAVQRTTLQQPIAIPVENVIVPHKDWVKDQMTIIEDSIWEAALAYSQAKGKDAKAVPKFVRTPEPELELLYEHVFGTNWQVRIGDIEDLGPHLKQIYVTMALFGAAIHTAVLASDSSWDCRAQLDADLGAYRRYFEATLKNRLANPERFLNDVACVQASDRDYQTIVVAKQARILAGSAAMTIQPHFRQLTLRTAITEEFEFQHWILHLEEAFSAAITLKQIITSSHLGPFEIRWPRSGEPVDPGAHRLRYKPANGSAEGFTTTVMHGM
ncbi:hypothetical protein CB0940_02584 [Cercospora beticola]|uniref:Uncharacterized protein n=1 Tax=Cercospora beticola TaxID=122368 RepID=A0A2G5I3H5_CERBT|nr:hypothetical protein CB0940_02584 [Cercospora beticola]PIA99366.1 hypothetical protein CB0940_02584 [Cercospora beticola]